MYIHLGQNVVVPKKGIVGIFDMDICTSSGITRSFLIKAEKEGEVIAISGDLPKVFAVYENKGTKRCSCRSFPLKHYLNDGIQAILRLDNRKE
jgi:hypothetical protein